MQIRQLRKEDLPTWIDMRSSLWPDEQPDQLTTDIEDPFDGRLGVFLAEEAEEAVGFVEVSMRSVADDCVSSPVGYLEGWWVAGSHRRGGIGRRLVEEATTWAAERGAVELASDAHADNTVSRAAHASLGFSENPRPVVKFRKSIRSKPGDPVDKGATVTLVPIDNENLGAVLRLDVAPQQRGMVAPNSVSLAQASFAAKAWPRAIYAGEVPVGFLLLWDDDEEPRYYLWRFMIDQRYQGRGFGAAAMNRLFEYVGTRPGGDVLTLSYVPLAGGPERFYKALGFVDTGAVEGIEVVAAKTLA